MDGERVVPLRSYGTERIGADKRPEHDELLAALWLADLIEANRRYRRAVRRRRRSTEHSLPPVDRR
jgi:hypothetical protein